LAADYTSGTHKDPEIVNYTLPVAIVFHNSCPDSGTILLSKVGVTEFANYSPKSFFLLLPGNTVYQLFWVSSL